MTERKKNINFQDRGTFCNKCKTSGGICKTLCWLIIKFDGGVNWLTLCNFRGVIEVLLISEG